MENSTCMHPHREREGDRQRQRQTERDKEGQTERQERERGEVHPGEVQQSILVQLSESGFIKVTITLYFSFHS